MKLVVGLGNPGEKYQHTLHNVGFAALDALATELQINKWSKRFKGLIVRSNQQNFPFILLKPQTFMNLSGEAVLACLQFFKLEVEDMLIISDDIDQAAGTLRYRFSGGHGGHNGLRNIIQLCGSNRFHRLKIGIGRPADSNADIAKYVLNQPSEEIRQLVNSTILRAVEYQLNFIKNMAIQIHSVA